jgi:hypothetical protein
LPAYEFLGLALLPNETMIGLSRRQVRAKGTEHSFHADPEVIS